MSEETHVDPAELRASAGAADAIADDMRGPADGAVKEAGAAGSSLAGWSFGPALTNVSTSWKPALDGLHARTKAGAANLRSSADGHEWNDQRTGQDFENIDTSAGSATTQATLGEMPSVLRRDSDQDDNSASHSFGPPPQGGPPLDPRTPYGTDMPSYDDGSVSTRPTPGENPFG
ncbi:type VII secretion target [Streptomyces sp. NPDC050738]|uniref:type VII secretion target n=1 Tax=Streptomyces sp. NPDC050738 TaxID=3154744 RepID=UPI003412F368